MAKRILIAPDKFKGSLSGKEICDILKKEISNTIPDIQIEICPLADGGDGSIEILSNYLEIKEKSCITSDPLGRPISASYFYSENAAYIELASASGLVLLEDDERNPMYTSTFGTGVLIKDALNSNLTEIYLFLGGSSSNDGGIGIANALGYKFLDASGKELEPVGKSLPFIASIKKDETVDFKSFTICCDVTNPPFGPHGAAWVYGKQKGANLDEIEHLDEGIKHLCTMINNHTGKDVSHLSGGGAAGGTALCPTAFFDGQIISGMDFISKMTNLETKVSNADLVISGEGKLDAQSFDGKVISGVSKLCARHDKDLWLTVGKNDLSEAEIEEIGAAKVFSIMEYAQDLEDAMQNGKNYLSKIGKEDSARVCLSLLLKFEPEHTFFMLIA